MSRYISQTLQPTVEAWFNKNNKNINKKQKRQSTLRPSNVYNMRIHQTDSMVAPHVLQHPLVVTALLHIHQDDEHDWPIHVVDKNQQEYNVTLKPGEMLLYDSTVVTGYPYPYKGDGNYVNILIHYNHHHHNEQQQQQQVVSLKQQQQQSLADLFQTTLAQQQQKLAKPSSSPSSPPTAMPSFVSSSPSYRERSRWKQDFFFEPRKARTSGKSTGGSNSNGNNNHFTVKRTKKSNDNAAINASKYKATQAHAAAAVGNLEKLKALFKTHPEYLTQEDANGWQPLHEAARGGHYNVVVWLLSSDDNKQIGGKIKAKVDINARTNSGKGGTALWWAESMHGKKHAVTEILRQAGGLKIGPNSKSSSTTPKTTTTTTTTTTSKDGATAKEGARLKKVEPKKRNIGEQTKEEQEEDNDHNAEEDEDDENNEEAEGEDEESQDGEESDDDDDDEESDDEDEEDEDEEEHGLDGEVDNDEDEEHGTDGEVDNDEDDDDVDMV